MMKQHRLRQNDQKKQKKKPVQKKKQHKKLHTQANAALTTCATKATKEAALKQQKRSFAQPSIVHQYTAPESVRKAPKFDFINWYANDAVVEEDKEKIDSFLTPIGLGDFKDKFSSFEQVLFTRSPILKRDFGMSVKERRLLRRKANHFRVGYYYKTGEIYQAKYPNRQPMSNRQYHRDESSCDEYSFAVPAKDGLYKASIRYPGATFRENFFMATYDEIEAIKNQGPKTKLPPRLDKAFEDFMRKQNVNAEAFKRDGLIQNGEQLLGMKEKRRIRQLPEGVHTQIDPTPFPDYFVRRANKDV
eukprot:UN04489